MNLYRYNFSSFCMHSDFASVGIPTQVVKGNFIFMFEAAHAFTQHLRVSCEEVRISYSDSSAADVEVRESHHSMDWVGNI